MKYPHLIKRNNLYISTDAITSKVDTDVSEMDALDFKGVILADTDMVMLKKHTYLRKAALVRLAFSFSDELADEVFKEIYSASDIKTESFSRTPDVYFEKRKIDSLRKSRSLITTDMISLILKTAAKNKLLRDSNDNILAEAIYVEVFRGIALGLFGETPSQITKKLQKDNGGFYAESYPFRENLTNWAEAEVLKLELDIVLNIESIILSSESVEDFSRRLKKFINSKRLKRKNLKEGRVIAFKDHNKFQSQVIFTNGALTSRIVMQ